ncbi:MFS transporter [Erwinia sp. P7711]|uniref:MFS transporter n=1 Tax=Erwinia sp. P7711 TaxID=3141451 RepID=UPI00318A8D64
MSNLIKTRFGLIYFSMFSFIGIHMPFWPVWLEYKGISPSGIAVLTALSFALKIVFTPVVSKIVDRTGQRREAVIVLACGLFTSIILFSQTDSFIPIMLMTILSFACWSPIMSLAESLATVTAREQKFDYGKVRLWGSVGFMAVAIFSGKLLEHFGEPALLWSICGAAGLLFISSCLLPKVSVSMVKNKDVNTSIFFKSKWFIWFLIATTLIQGSHAAYYTFGSIYWRAEGLSDQIIGLLWGSSMAVEVMVFAFGRSILSRLGPVNVLAIGGAAAAFRWLVIGSNDNLILLLIAQCLHALSFGACHFAAMQIITDKVDASLSSTAQGIYSAFSMGLGMGVFVLLSGPLYSSLLGGTFYVMSAVSLSGTVCLRLMRAAQMNEIALNNLPPSTEKARAGSA